ncbi:hypothetical protein C8R46DRAFT_1328580 [Mycena filopes]|nr:hypothetical protein C8R46DRAFT_1328580 [Mycena filopes]
MTSRYGAACDVILFVVFPLALNSALAACCKNVSGLAQTLKCTVRYLILLLLALGVSGLFDYHCPRQQPPRPPNSTPISRWLRKTPVALSSPKQTRFCEHTSPLLTLTIDVIMVHLAAIVLTAAILLLRVLQEYALNAVSYVSKAASRHWAVVVRWVAKHDRERYEKQSEQERRQLKQEWDRDQARWKREKVRKDNELANEQLKFQSLKDSLICSVCLDVLHRPYVTSCGHIVGFYCLRSWFCFAPPSEDPAEDLNVAGPDYCWLRSKACPVCRASIKDAPIPVYTLNPALAIICGDVGGDEVLLEPWKGIFYPSD